jgi:hypothetical protein
MSNGSIDATEEVWVEIPGKPGYVVSNLGQVMSPFGRILKPQKNGKYGYVGVCLGKGPRYYLHRLVAAAFIGDGEGLDVDHINGDTSDNRLSNLRYLSHAENMAAQRERKPTCRKGHTFADAYWDPRGRRQCRTCRAEADRRRKRP